MKHLFCLTSFLVTSSAIAGSPCVTRSCIVQHQQVQQVLVQDQYAVQQIVAPVVVRVPVQDYLATGNLTHYYSAGYTQQLLESEKSKSVAEEVIKVLIERGILNGKPVAPAPTTEQPTQPTTPAEPPQPAPTEPTSLDNAVAGHLGGNCVTCHNNARKQGGFSLEGVDVSLMPVDTKLEIFRRVSGIGLKETESKMPPSKTLPNNVESDLLKWVLQK